MTPSESEPNTSGQGERSNVPSEIRRWNWGAFLLSWIWGLGNGTERALLVFVPILGLAMPFVLGAKGNEWAWRNRKWKDVKAFQTTQRRWAWAGLVAVVLIPAGIFSFGLLATTLLHVMHDNGAFKSSYAAITRNFEVQAILGKPIKAGWFVQGRIRYYDGGGEAVLSYSLSGSRRTGRAQVYATYDGRHWTPQEVIVMIPGSLLEIPVIVDGRRPGIRGPV